MKASSQKFSSFGQQRIVREDSGRQLKQSFGYHKPSASTNSGSMAAEVNASSESNNARNSDYALMRNLQDATENLGGQSNGGKQGILRGSHQTYRIPQRKQHSPNSKETYSNKLSMTSTTETDKDEIGSMKPLQSTQTDGSFQISKLKKSTGVPRGLKKPLAVEPVQNEELNDVGVQSPRISRSLKKPLQSGLGNDELSITAGSKSFATVRSLKKPLQSSSENGEMSIAIGLKSPGTARSLKKPMQSGLKKSPQISANGRDFETAANSPSQTVYNNEVKPLQSNSGECSVSSQSNSCLKQPNQISKARGDGNTKGILKPQEVQRNLYNAGCTDEKKPVQCDADREDSTMIDRKTSSLNSDIRKPVHSTNNASIGSSTPTTSRRTGIIRKPLQSNDNEVLGNSTPTISRKTGVSKYDERQGIKPRATPNKGRVGTVSSNKQPTLRKESVVSSQETALTKRATVEAKTVDCHLQKKSLQERQSTDNAFQESNQQSNNTILGVKPGSKIGLIQTARGNEAQFQELKSGTKSIAFEVEFREAEGGSEIKPLGIKHANKGKIGYGNGKARMTQSGRIKLKGKVSESLNNNSSPKKVSFEDEAIAVRRKLSEQTKERISKNNSEANNGTSSIGDQNTIDLKPQRDQRRKDANSKNKGQLMIIGCEKNNSDTVLTSFKDVMNDSDRPIADEVSESSNQQTNSNDSNTTHLDSPDEYLSENLANLSNPNGKQSSKVTIPGNMNRNLSGKLTILANPNSNLTETPVNLGSSNSNINAELDKPMDCKPGNLQSGLRRPKSISHTIKSTVLERTHDKACHEVSKREARTALQESQLVKSRNSQERKISPLVVKEHDSMETNTLASKNNTCSGQNNITKTDAFVLASFVGSADANGPAQIKTCSTHSDGDLRTCEGGQITTNRKTTSDWASQTGSLDRVSLKRRNEQKRRENESRDKFKSVSDQRIVSVSSENVNRLDIAFTSFGKTTESHRNDLCSASSQELAAERKLGGSSYALPIVDEENASRTFGENQANKSRIGRLSSSSQRLGSNTRLMKLDEEKVTRDVEENYFRKQSFVDNQVSRGVDLQIEHSLNSNLSANNGPCEDNSLPNGPKQHVYSATTNTEAQLSSLEIKTSPHVNNKVVSRDASFLKSNRPAKLAESETNNPGQFTESDSNMGNYFAHAFRPKLPPRDSSIPCVKRSEEDMKKNEHDLSNNRPVISDARDCTVVSQGQHERMTTSHRIVGDREKGEQLTRPVALKSDMEMDVASTRPVGKVVPPPRTVFKDTKSGDLGVRNNRDNTEKQSDNTAKQSDNTAKQSYNTAKQSDNTAKRIDNTAKQSELNTRNESSNNNSTSNISKPKKKESFVAALARMMEEARNSAIQGRKDEAEELLHTRSETVTIVTPSTGSSIDSQDPFYQFAMRNNQSAKTNISSENHVDYQQNTTKYPRNHLADTIIQNYHENNPKSLQRQTNMFSASTTAFETNPMRQPHDDYPSTQTTAYAQQNSVDTRNESFHIGDQYQRDSGNPKTLSFTECNLSSAGIFQNQFPTKMDNTVEMITVSGNNNQLHRQEKSSQSDHLNAEFIMISGQKDNLEYLLNENRTRLTSFGTARSSNSGVQVKHIINGDGSNILKNPDTNRIGIQLNESMGEGTPTEVKNILNNLSEINALRNAIKLSQKPSTKNKKHKGKRKGKTNKANRWESGQNEMFYSAGGETEQKIDESIDESEEQSLLFQKSITDPKEQITLFEKPTSECKEQSALFKMPINKPNKQKELFKKPITNGDVDNWLLFKSEAPERGVIMGSNTTDYHLGLAVMEDGAAGSENFNSALMFNKSICDENEPQKIEDYSQSGLSVAGDVLREKLEFPDRQILSDKMDFGVRATGSPKTKPSAKIKPYTVVDLSTMAALSPEEVDVCLKEVSESEKLNQERENGDSSISNENSSEAPDSIVLPPKTARNRSNTTTSARIREHESPSLNLGQKVAVDGSQGMQIVSMSMEYSRPGQLYQQNELSSFRARSKTVPNVLGDLYREEPKDDMSSKMLPYQAEHPETNATKSANQGAKHDPCGTSSPLNQSVEFPPPPSNEALAPVNNEVDRCKTPDWPPVPDVIDDGTPTDSQKEEQQIAVKGKEYYPECVFIPGVGYSRNLQSEEEVKQQSGSTSKDIKKERIADAHRSLPPIPGSEVHPSQDPNAQNADGPLSWVSRATNCGPGPFIPMCHSSDEGEDIQSSHFYDDIDQIRKIAQERALMIKRLEEEQADIELAKRLLGIKDETRNSLGEMPDLIPNETEVKSNTENEEEAGLDRGEVKTRSKRWKKKSKKDAKGSNDPSNDKQQGTNESETLGELPLSAVEKKNRSRFARLIRKLSAPIKANPSQDFIQRKATTPQPTRKGIDPNKVEDNRNEVFATPATNRRFFSVSVHQRARTTSDTDLLQGMTDKESTSESKRSKHRAGTISFGFGRKKIKKANITDQDAYSDDNRSIMSLELMKIGSDFSSESGSSTRLAPTPTTSPSIPASGKNTTKYRAPDPPTWRKLPEEHRKDEADRTKAELKEEIDDKTVGNTHKLTKTDDLPSTDRNGLQNTAKPSEKITVDKTVENSDNVARVLPNTEQTITQHQSVDVPPRSHVNLGRQGVDRPVARLVGNTKNEENQDDVFTNEGAYDNYPPSKLSLERPTKPPRSESDDKDPPSIKMRPEKPRRKSKEADPLMKPEPYSSQRIHRKIIGQRIGLAARLSPTLSNSEDESSRDEDSGYCMPFDNIKTKNQPENWGDRTFKSSASDYCLSNRLRKGDDVSRSEDFLDRSNKGRRRVSSASTNATTRRPESPKTDDSDDSYYENIHGKSAKQRDKTLRYSIDSYDKLLEIHRDTVRQIAEATVFKCDCRELGNTSWNDFEICGKMLNFGISSYVTMPVVVKQNGKKSDERFTAWLRQSLGFLQKSSAESEQLSIKLQTLTLHENILHICQDIQQNRGNEENSSDEIPLDIHVNRMLVSKCTPRMTLAKYLSLTMDKHARDPESYEREACLILLQLLKGLGHLRENGVMLEGIDCETVLLADVYSGVLSPNYINNNNEEDDALSCPNAMCLAMPGLVKNCVGAKNQDSKCQKGQSEVEMNEGHMSTDGVKGEERSTAGVKGDSGLSSRLQSEVNSLVEKVQVHVSAHSSSDEREKEQTTKLLLSQEISRELCALIFDLFHSPQNLEGDLPVANRTSGNESSLPRMPVRSQYSQRLQLVIDHLCITKDDSCDINKLIDYLQVISFCPVLVDDVDDNELILLLDKWRNRRCVDMVTDILKKYSLISLAQGLASGGKENMGLARNCVLECQFLSSMSTEGMRDVVSIMGRY